MTSIIFVVNNRGFLSFKTSNNYLTLLGEFLAIDINYMPDFGRALLESPFEENTQLNACSITTNETSITLSSIIRTQDPAIICNKGSILDIITLWEQTMLSHNRSYFVKEMHIKDVSYEIFDKTQSILDQKQKLKQI